MEGSIKWFNKRKGFGFIEGIDGKDYFVHHTQINEFDDLKEKDQVTFEPVSTEKGFQAQAVKKI